MPNFNVTYFGPIEWYRALYYSMESVFFDKEETFQKQTFRNRCIIASPNGPQKLSIPVIKGSSHHQLMRDVQISDHGNWRHLHWQAIKTAYGESPFFEYYQDYLRPFYIDETIIADSLRQPITPPCRYKYLIDYDMATIELCRMLIGNIPDIGPRPETLPEQQKYHQVYQHKFGFLTNMSILDLLMNEGPESKNILK